MSKPRKCMQQVPEIARIARPNLRRAIGSCRVLLRCSMVVAIVTMGIAACDSGSGSNERLSSAELRTGQPNVVRMLRRGLPGEPRTLDPQLADDDFSFQVVRDLFEGLTAEDPSGQIVPGAASSWTLDDTGTIYTFHLRPDAKWSNGDRTVAEEFVQGLRRAVDPKTASGSAGLLAVIKGAGDIIAGHKNVSELGVTAIDESSIRIELEHPAPFVLQILSQPIAAPVHATAIATTAKHQPSQIVGVYNGAYILVGRVPGSFIDLARNPHYWNATGVSIEKVRYVNLESEATELREYVSGQLDMTFTIPMPDLARISEKFGAEVQIAPTLGTSYLALNESEGALKNNPWLRQALSMGVDREQIAEHVMIGVTPAYSLVANGTNGYVPPKYEWANWSRDRQLTYARSLFARAGYSEKNPLHLRLYFSSGEGIQRIMIAIAGSWKQNLGVVSELISDEFRVFLAGRKDRSRWDIARLKWDADYNDPSSFLDVFSEDSNQNDPAYSSAAFSNLIAKARIEPRPEVRTLLLRNAEQVLLNDYPIIPIYFTESRRLVKPYVGGAKINPMNRTYSKNLFWK